MCLYAKLCAGHGNMRFIYFSLQLFFIIRETESEICVTCSNFLS